MNIKISARRLFFFFSGRRGHTRLQGDWSSDVCFSDLFDGSSRELVWGELQDLATQAAHTLAAEGIGRGARVAVVLPPAPETAAIFFGVWKLGEIGRASCRGRV